MEKYRASDFFMIRTPLLPLEDYLLLNECSIPTYKNLKNKFNTPELNEALVIASKNLYDSYKELGAKNNRKSNEQVESALLKYWMGYN